MKIAVEVFVTHACPHCSSAEARVAEVVAALGKERFDVRIVDVVEELDHAVATGVLRTPAIAVNGAVQLTGWPAAEVVRRVLQRATEGLMEHSRPTWRNSA